ncbi:AcrR family transcriptional regulator [Nocardiopsis gilva]
MTTSRSSTSRPREAEESGNGSTGHLGHTAWPMLDTAGQALSQAPLRRLPAQQRSMVRVQRMLDACAELLDEVGYDELSTTRIAERANVAIGSVYQFFPDKKAITQALGLRYLDMFSARVTDRLSQGDFSHWSEAVDVIIDEYLDMHRHVPGFRSLHFGDAVDIRLFDANNDNNQVIAARLRDLLISIAGVEESAELDRAITVAVESADAVLKLAFRCDPEGDQHLIDETKLLLRSYLSRHFA